MKSGGKIVLDAWAILALILKEEPAAGTVKEIIEAADAEQSKIYVSWINIGEVYHTIGKSEGLEFADEILETLKLLPLSLESPTPSGILDASRFKAMYRISYADAFAVSLAVRLDGILCTGDPEILSLKKVVNIKPLSRTPNP